MFFARLDSNDGELLASVLATALGVAIVAGASEGISMLKKQDTRLALVGFLEQFAVTMPKLTPVVVAML